MMAEHASMELLMIVETNEILTNNEFPVHNVGRKIISEDNGEGKWSNNLKVGYPADARIYLLQTDLPSCGSVGRRVEKNAKMLPVVCKNCRLTPQLHESAGGLPRLKLPLH
ncbi:hypothetical protein Tco_1416469, partial [Tanacetum coccineum]